jgi:hypothetical protein
MLIVEQILELTGNIAYSLVVGLLALTAAGCWTNKDYIYRLRP